LESSLGSLNQILRAFFLNTLWLFNIAMV
jgi:hypothetical protein